MRLVDVTAFLDNKIVVREDEIVITYYELRVKMELSETETTSFLSYCRTRLKNLGYKVYTTGQQVQHQNAHRTVQINELMIAIKEERGESLKTEEKRYNPIGLCRLLDIEVYEGDKLIYSGMVVDAPEDIKAKSYKSVENKNNKFVYKV